MGRNNNVIYLDDRKKKQFTHKLQSKVLNDEEVYERGRYVESGYPYGNTEEGFQKYMYEIWNPDSSDESWDDLERFIK